MSQVLTGLDALLEAAPKSQVLQVLQKRGQDTVRHAGLPGRKTEAWKYTRIKTLTEAAWTAPPRVPVPLTSLPSAVPLGDALARIVIVNGRFDASLSQLDTLTSGVSIAPLPEAMSEDADLANSIGTGFMSTFRDTGLSAFPMVALNDACFEDGVLISVSNGITVSVPIVVTIVTTKAETAFAAHPRVYLRLGEGAAAILVEEHVASGKASSQTVLSNTVMEMSLAADAHLGHYRVTDMPTGMTSITSTALSLEARSSYDGFTLSLGEGVSRCETRLALQGERSEAIINGAYLGIGDAHIDNTTQIDHAVPNCVSRENFRGVVTDRARGVFQGRVLVRPDAQNTDGHQMHKALLLSDKAEIDAKPELEIYADDVRCSHGATTGALDPMHLFYLRARGIAEPQARALLLEAFLVEAVDLIQDADICQAFQKLIAERLASVSLFDVRGENP